MSGKKGVTAAAYSSYWRHLIEKPLRQTLKNKTNTMEGKASDLLHNENVKKAYLGI